MRHRTAAAVALLLLQALAAGDAAAQGIRFDVGMFVVQPDLDARSALVFERLGRFRPAVGAAGALGYHWRRFGAALSGAVAPVELGETRVRDGVGAGREQALYSSVALVGSWRRESTWGRWRPGLAIGYVRTTIGEALLAGDSLPDFASALGAAPPDSSRRQLGIYGHGVRFGASLLRAVPSGSFFGNAAMSVEATVDAVSFRRLAYGDRRTDIPDPGIAMIPRLGVVLQW